MPLRAPLLSAGLALCVLGAAACGGDGGGGGGGAGGGTTAPTAVAGTGEQGPPKAQEPVSSAVAQLDDFARAKSCKQRLRYLRTFGPDAMPGVSREDCAIARRVSDELDGLLPIQSSRSRQFEVGAVTDVTTRGRTKAVVWTLDTDGRFKYFLSFPVSEPELATSPKDSGRFDEGVAAEWIAAVRARDCPRMFGLFVADSTKVQGRTEGEFCALLPAAYRNEDGFFGRAVAAPGTRPQFFGGTENLGFHGVRLAPDSYYTIITATAASDMGRGRHASYGILDYTPAQRPTP